MSRQRCHSRARQLRYLLPLVALAHNSPYASIKLPKLKYVEILDFALISTYFLLGSRGAGKKTVKFMKKIFFLVTRTTEMSVSQALL